MRNLLLILILFTTALSAQVMSFVKPSTVLDNTNGLLAFWKFEESASPYSDYTGTYALSKFWAASPASVDGIIGKAVDFEWDTRDNSLFSSVAGALAFDNVTFTLSCWVKFESIESTYFVGLMSRYNISGGKREYGIFCNNSLKCFDFRISSDGLVTASAKTPDASVTTGVWYNVVGWYNAVTDSAYIAINDGTIYRTYWATGSKPASNDFFLGTNHSLETAHMDGIIDCAGVWSVCPQASNGYAMLTSLYNSGAGWEPE